MEIKHFACVVDGILGAFAPKVFAKNYPSCMDGSERDTLLAGPDHPDYWDVWSDIRGRGCWDGDIWQGESGDIFILSDSPMQALITAWESMECLDSCPVKLRKTVKKLSYKFLADWDDFISEEEALQHFSPFKYNTEKVNKALEWMHNELKEVYNG